MKRILNNFIYALFVTIGILTLVGICYVMYLSNKYEYVSIEDAPVTPMNEVRDSADQWLYEYTIDFIKSCEGYMPSSYYCVANYLTIGYGHVLKKEDTFTFLSYYQADSLLRSDFNWYVDFVKHSYTDLPYHKQIALAHFAYCCGHGAMQMMYREEDILNALKYTKYRKEGKVIDSELMHTVRKFNVDIYNEHPFK